MSETKKPFRVWSADREKRYGIVADSFQNLKIKAAQKLDISLCEDNKLVLEEDGTMIDESYWETLKDHTRLILLHPSETWKPQPLWPPDLDDKKVDFVDGNNLQNLTAEQLFVKLQHNPAIMVMLDLSEMETIKDADFDQIDGQKVNKELAKGLQEKCVDLYLMKKKEQEALEVIELLQKKKSSVCS
ncbi:UNVERIFIED_CONTAM: hypothetical protein RMT77_005630 [Armadillidium vulgare]